MLDPNAFMNRRRLLQSASGLLLGGVSLFGADSKLRADPTTSNAKGRVAITLDLEMARNFPRREDTHWDYEKRNLNDAAKTYSVEAAQRP